jgi:hypothetical protein
MDKYFDSVTPTQLVQDLADYLPDSQKNRNIRDANEIPISDWDRLDEYIYGKFDLMDFVQTPDYTLQASIWYMNDNEGYIFLIINDTNMSNKIIHYTLTPVSSSSKSTNNSEDLQE